MRPRLPLLLPSVALLALACTTPDDSPTAPDAAPPEANAARGGALFTAECASCHASGDGGDLALFRFPDSTIVRRALGHVGMQEARDIVAHIHTLKDGGFDRKTRLFQPRDVVLADDRTFALALFGTDRWPVLGTKELLAIDPRQVPLALALPRWSVEENNLDWMPDGPLAREMLAYRGAGELLAAYHRTRSDETLVATVSLLRSATRAEATGAPCALVNEAPADPERCFEALRWISSLGAQHMLRTGRQDGLHRVVHDAFWDVGQAVRRSLLRGGVDLGNANENWATWMMVGWIFEPGNHASTYTGTGLQRMELPRHATFVALRSMVSRPKNSDQPFKDVLSAARFAPPHWAANAAVTGFRHLEERLAAGEKPRLPMDKTMADLRADVQNAVRMTVRKDPSSASSLIPLAERVLALLPAS